MHAYKLAISLYHSLSLLLIARVCRPIIKQGFFRRRTMYIFSNTSESNGRDNGSGPYLYI